MPRRKATAQAAAATTPETPTPSSIDRTGRVETPAAESVASTDSQTAGRNYGPNPHPIRTDVAAGVRLQEDKRFRQMQVRFDEKPSDAVRQAVRDAGFQWRQQEEVWSKAIDREHGWKTRADAERLYEQVTDMIRDEKGIARER